MCMHVCICMCVSVCIRYVHHMCAWYTRRPEDGIACPGIGVTDGCKPPCGFWESNPGHLQEQPGLLYHLSSAQDLLSPLSTTDCDLMAYG